MENQLVSHLIKKHQGTKSEIVLSKRPDEKERIEAAGGHVRRAHPGGILRVEGRLAVSRAIGDFKYKMGEMVVSPDPEISQFRLDSNSDFIIAACDGCKVYSMYSLVSVGCIFKRRGSSNYVQQFIRNKRCSKNM